MDEVRNAITKAEGFLFEVIEQSRFKSNICEIDPDFCDPASFWPLRFEAYSYLGAKYKDKVRSYAYEIRMLWDEWIRLTKDGKFYLGVFWPHRLGYWIQLEAGNEDSDIIEFPVHELEKHISMFQGKRSI